MRVALMALMQDGAAAVRLGGKPVAWHQLQAALKLGCERVVCLAESPGPELSALQREAEARDAKFSAITHSRALSGHVSAADTLFVFAPGVMPDREWLMQTLGARAGIAVFSADEAVERGFERIDRDRAWGGVLATRGDSVEALALLPPDADPIAGLLRVALQRGGRCVEVPEHWIDEGRWVLLGDDAEAQRLERSWLARHVPAPGIERPGEAAAHAIARVLAPRAAGRPVLAPLLSIGGTALAAAGGAMGYLGYVLAGLVALVLGALASKTGERLDRFDRAGSGTTSSPRLAEVRDGILDVALVAIAASPQEFAGWHAPFVGLVLVAAMRLLREQGTPRALRVLGDRVLVYLGLGVAAAFDGFVPVMAAIGLAALAGKLFVTRHRS